MPFVRAIPVVCSAVLVICSASAQQVPANADAQPASAAVILGDIQTAQHGTALEIKIPAHGVTPHKMLMKDPDRIVLDFHGAQFGGGNQRLAVNQAGVLQIRASQFQVDPPVARIVIDLSKPLPSHLEAVGDSVVLQINTVSGAPTSQAAVQAPTAKPSAAKPSAKAAAPAAATPAPQGSANAVVEGLDVHSGKGELSFSVKLSQAVTPKLWSEREPDRYVMDFPGTLPGNTSRRITVGDGSVQTVRLSLFQGNPPVTRIVFDVATGTKRPQVEPNGKDLTVKFETASSGSTAAVAMSKPESSAVAASKPSPVVRHAAVQATSRPPVVARASAPQAAPVAAAKQASPQTPAADMYGPHPPNIRFANGLLSIEANNSVLTDILFEVGSKTGAEIQMPPWSDAGRERVVAKLGPGNPRDVIAALLHGSSFNYVIVESPQGLQQLILTPKTDWAGPQGGDQPTPAADTAPIETPPADTTPPPPDNPQ